MTHRIRRAEWKDREQIGDLYRIVALESGGLARRPEEITASFLDHLLQLTSRNGLVLVMESPGESPETRRLDGIIHAECGEIEDLHHVMGHLTLLIQPRLQGRGYGKALFSAFLREIRSSFPFVYRVELRARASNRAALGLYESLGFIREGLFHSRIRTRDGNLEDGIPMVWFNPDWKDFRASLKPFNDAGADGSAGPLRDEHARESAPRGPLPAPSRHA